MLKQSASGVPCLRRSGFAQAGRVAQRLNVRNRVRFATLLAAALLDDLFEHPVPFQISGRCPLMLLRAVKPASPTTQRGERRIWEVRGLRFEV